jgi:2-dehydropantoate 2-reductase
MKLFKREDKAEPTHEPFRGRIGIIGAGALGAFYGARLSRAGHDVHFLMRRDYEAVQADGLHIKSFEGDFHINPPVYASAEEIGRCDLVIIGLKSTDNAVLQSLLEYVADDKTLILTLQNGLGNEEAIASALGGESAASQILGGTAFLCSNRIGPGKIHHSDHGWIRMAEFQGEAQPRTHAVAALFKSAGIRCELADSLLHARWEKLVWNIPFNGLGVAARGADTETVLSSEPLSATARGLMEEVVAAAKADRVTLNPEIVKRMMNNTKTMGAYKTSMQVDYEAGRPLELEAIIGEPLRRAQKAAIPTPRMEMLYGILLRLNELSRPA